MYLNGVNESESQILIKVGSEKEVASVALAWPRGRSVGLVERPHLGPGLFSE